MENFIFCAANELKWVNLRIYSLLHRLPENNHEVSTLAYQQKQTARI